MIQIGNVLEWVCKNSLKGLTTTYLCSPFLARARASFSVPSQKSSLRCVCLNTYTTRISYIIQHHHQMLRCYIYVIVPFWFIYHNTEEIWRSLHYNCIYIHLYWIGIHTGCVKCIWTNFRGPCETSVDNF